ncbi:MFS transporter [Pigmentiphaga sp. NML080357]|uniref:tripartite tricarboxylate transporter substrate binding protein n=1 Tax=Pigmentiphaga sp. NML080357 TaxID=2008675 RepID=UPI000B4114E5|nr:tripartite tricarboxylate transporter substrate binding protein [Pigmentiphaga sp. NML080357]OVZ57220.1 MFS transporter [Pigmentiphaga sp. NML080357]
MSIRRNILGAALAVAAFVAGPAAAQDAYPQGPATMIVPFPAGGPTDVLARIVSQQLAETWKHPVIVDYKPGASTMLGTAAVARAAPDGYTIGVVNSAYVINPSLQKKLLYKNDDLAAVTQLIRVPLAIAANPGAPFNTLDELVDYAKRHPGAVTFASPGTGGTSHLAGELLARRAGVDLVHVPYKGSAPAHTDVIGGRVMVMIDPIFSLMPHIQSGRLKMLATTGPKREAAYPDYAAVAEKYPGFSVQAFIGLVVPAGTPAAIIDKIQRDAAAALAMPSVKQRVEGLGMAIVASRPSEFESRIKTETEQWARVIRDAKIELQD